MGDQLCLGFVAQCTGMPVIEPDPDISSFSLCLLNMLLSIYKSTYNVLFGNGVEQLTCNVCVKNSSLLADTVIVECMWYS